MPRALSTLEVAALAGLDERKIRKEVELGLFHRPRFSVEDLVYFKLLAVLGLTVSVADRRRLHSLVEEAMRQRPTPRTIALSKVTHVRLAEVAAEIGQKLDRFSAWKKKIVEDPNILGGEPVFPKSRTAVRHVGGLLLRGVPQREIREDFPHLSDIDVELAPLYAKAYPKQGRPREAAPR
jgi:uncharacterized protein (DUF433 family)